MIDARRTCSASRSSLHIYDKTRLTATQSEAYVLRFNKSLVFFSFPIRFEICADQAARQRPARSTTGPLHLLSQVWPTGVMVSKHFILIHARRERRLGL
jgi:hypothetical protein